MAKWVCVAMLAGLALLAGCGGGDDDDERQTDVQPVDCMAKPLACR